MRPFSRGPGVRTWPLLALLAAGPLMAQPAGKRYTVLVGINQYEHEKLRPLQYAENDAVELANLPKQAGYEVDLLTDGSADDHKPTRANIEARLHAVLRNCRRADTVVVALAGHGLQFDGRKDCFFCPQDARPFKDETGTLLSLAAVYA
jgi:uncharacterized caspase-like protein